MIAMLTGYADVFAKRVLLITFDAKQAQWVRRHRLPPHSPVVVESCGGLLGDYAELPFDVFGLDDLGMWPMGIRREIRHQIIREAATRHIVTIEAP